VSEYDDLNGFNNPDPGFGPDIGGIVGTCSFTGAHATVSGTGSLAFVGTGAFSAQHATLASNGDLIFTGTVAFLTIHAAINSTGEIANPITGTVAFAGQPAVLTAVGDIADDIGVVAFQAVPATLDATGSVSASLAQPQFGSWVPSDVPAPIDGRAAFAAVAARVQSIGEIINPIVGTVAVTLSPPQARATARYTPAPISGFAHFRARSPRGVSSGAIDNTVSFDAEDEAILLLLSA
jgi:hypothetical protein